MLVATGTKLSDYFDLYLVFAMCSATHFIATLMQINLRMRMSSKKGSDVKRQANDDPGKADAREFRKKE